MTIRHLRIFITIVECKTMRKAAEKLYISQPAVSQAVSELEKYYGVKLFERLSQRLYITEAGKTLLSYARHIVSSFEDMESAMFDVSSRMTIKVGGSVSIGTTMLIDIVEKLEEEISGIDVRVTVDNTSTIENKVCLSELDLAIVEGCLQSDEIIQIPVHNDELVMVVGKNHLFWDRQSISISELHNQDVISREEGSTNRNQFEQLLIENKIKINKKWRCTNTEAIKNLVKNGKGIAIISKLLIEKEIEDGKLRVLNVDNLKVFRENKLIYHKNKYISPQMKKFIDICTNRYT
ncbi:LysR family transcriptional regulator [Terrisporobacter mayombei]|uniref:HTH-type transcriptional activator CmpR n=1 Tax=Terrisporobacter mayombei TaxID=1541 RepID=A0ABY9PYC9_9FIRM|nr:LysR family transcriptional regulator [Terrisporobacter mayombei]MCC3868563.1 LysR family transcriptional regulator [Terrisporobacter mayombei]WMT80720.1 HTH-type transcriptional activator CmpR [Terrisporobacter mayombei]